MCVKTSVVLRLKMKNMESGIRGGEQETGCSLPRWTVPLPNLKEITFGPRFAYILVNFPAMMNIQ